eukprot:SAG31_NODE_12317_length_950_cov_0.734430_1_plen_109_part_00
MSFCSFANLEHMMLQGSAEIRAAFLPKDSGGKTKQITLSVTTNQAIILLQFNGNTALTFEELSSATKMQDGELVRNLQSLSLVKKHLVLHKSPGGKEVLRISVLGTFA